MIICMLRKRNRPVVKYLRFLKTVNRDENVTQKKDCRIGILLTSWVGLLSVPLYGITIGLLLKNKGYTNISFVVNDLLNKKNSLRFGDYSEMDSILRLLKNKNIAKFHFEVIRLSKIEDEIINNKDRDIMRRYANLNTIKYCGNSLNDQKHKLIFEKWINIYSVLSKKIKRCEAFGWDRFIIPGGMFQETGLILEMFREKGIDVITYDSGEERYKIGINVCAAQNGNVSTTAKHILSRNRDLDKIKDIAEKILENRMKGQPELSVVGQGKIIQNVAYGHNVDQKYDVIIFTNLEFDTAALGTHTVFENDYQWILETIQFVLQYTDATIAIRQHPLQRQFKEVTTNEESIKKIFEGNNRVTFIDYNSKINSYDLLENAKVIIVNTSTIGLEAGLLGRSVVTDSQSYYSEASFVQYSNTKAAYFDNIQKTLRGEIQTEETDKLEAAVYYFLTQKCSSVLTNFTPQPMDFNLWVKRKFTDLSNDRAIEYLLDAIVGLKSVDRQVYEEIFENECTNNK